MNKKIVFFDGDGTLCYPHATKRTEKPWWIYADENTKEDFLKHLVLTPHAGDTIRFMREAGIKTIILSTHPHEPQEAALVLGQKLHHFNIHDLFDEIHATREYPEAKGEVIEAILQRLQISLEHALMVGDSYKWDYLSAEAKGVDAVLINSEYHQENKGEEPAEYIIDELDELLPMLGLV